MTTCNFCESPPPSNFEQLKVARVGYLADLRVNLLQLAALMCGLSVLNQRHPAGARPGHAFRMKRGGKKKKEKNNIAKEIKRRALLD